MIKQILSLVFVLILFACTSNAAVFSDPSIPIEVQTGDRFTIELDSNAITGYSWEFGKPLDENILKLVKSDYVPPKSGLSGASGSQVWVFEALHPGSIMIVLEYKRNWEREPPIQTADYTIHVK